MFRDVPDVPDVPGCSGMFRNVPECSGMFHVPGFIDAPFAFPLCILVPHGELIPSSFLN